MTTVDMIDVTHGSLVHLPRKLPVKKVALYGTGSPDIRATAEDWAHLENAERTLSINQANEILVGFDICDIETGAMTVPVAVRIAQLRRDLHRTTTFYVQASRLVECENAVHAAGLGDWVFYWIADWNMNHETASKGLGGRIVAIQWASPSSNPHTLIPGTNLTLAQANVDLSVTLDSWFPLPPAKRRRLPIIHRTKKPKPKPKPIHPKVKGAATGGGLTTGFIALIHAVAHVHLTPAEASAIATVIAALTGYYVPGPKVKP